MASVTATDFINVMNITDSATNMEPVLDLAIDTLNLYGAASISNMSGDAGSKTVSLTSKQRGAVFHLARMIYYDFFKGINRANVGPVTVTASELLTNPAYISAIKVIARRLKTVGFSLGEDVSGIEYTS